MSKKCNGNYDTTSEIHAVYSFASLQFIYLTQTDIMGSQITSNMEKLIKKNCSLSSYTRGQEYLMKLTGDRLKTKRAVSPLRWWMP